MSNVGRCTSAVPPMTDPAKGANWNGWGGTVTNTRYVPADKGGITAPLVPRLKLKWAFGFPGVTAARSQPVVVGGRLFVASESGDVFSLEREDRLHLLGVSRAVGHSHGGVGRAVQERERRVRLRHLLRRRRGQRVRRRREHAASRSGRGTSTSIRSSRATGSPTYYNGRVYVPMAGLGEEGAGRTR